LPNLGGRLRPNALGRSKISSGTGQVPEGKLIFRPHVEKRDLSRA